MTVAAMFLRHIHKFLVRGLSQLYGGLRELNMWCPYATLGDKSVEVQISRGFRSVLELPLLYF